MGDRLFRLALVAAALAAAGCETTKIATPIAPTVVQGIEEVFVTPIAAEEPVGRSRQFVGIVTGSELASKAVTWTSSNPAVATVDSGGLARCAAPGMATIVATSVVDVTKRGFSSLTCTAAVAPAPKVFNVTPGTVDVAVDRTSTLEHVCAFRIDALGAALAMAYKSDHAGLAPAVSAGAVPAGGFALVSVFYKGPQSAPFTTKLRFIATTAQGTQEIEVPVTIRFK